MKSCMNGVYTKIFLMRTMLSCNIDLIHFLYIIDKTVLKRDLKFSIMPTCRKPLEQFNCMFIQKNIV